MSDITSKMGMSILRAILSGERNAEKLASFRDRRCKNSVEVIAKSLMGNYRKEHIFSLKQSIELYDVYHEKLRDCDYEIEQQLAQFEKQTDLTEE